MNNAIKGLIFKLLNINFFCLLSLTLHQIGSALPTPLIFSLLNLFGLLFILPAVAKKIFTPWLRQNAKSFVLRGLLNNFGICTWLLAIKYLGPNEATAISFAIPVITIILSAIFCGDKISSSIIFTVLLCICGGYIIISPNLAGEFTIVGVCFAILSSFAWAGYDIICKLQSKTENVIGQSFKNCLYSGVISVLFLGFYADQLANINIVQNIIANFNLIFLAAVISLLNIAVLFLAYSKTKVSYLMPISYLRLFIMSLYTYMFFGQVIVLSTILGGTVIFIANLSNYFINLRASQNKISKI